MDTALSSPSSSVGPRGGSPRSRRRRTMA
ncbi:hypothetical protein AHiyo6_31270, partial [Arthrobacter sp. Hiyo6]